MNLAEFLRASLFRVTFGCCRPEFSGLCIRMVKARKKVAIHCSFSRVCTEHRG